MSKKHSVPFEHSNGIDLFWRNDLMFHEKPSVFSSQEVGSGNTSQKSDEDDFVKVEDLPLQLSVISEVSGRGLPEYTVCVCVCVCIISIMYYE